MQGKIGDNDTHPLSCKTYVRISKGFAEISIDLAMEPLS